MGASAPDARARNLEIDAATMFAAPAAAPPVQPSQPKNLMVKCDSSKPRSFKTYSRFGRDPEVYFYVIDHVLYGLAREAAVTTNVIKVWSAGSAGGEEPYALAIAWHAVLAERFPTVRLEIVGTDIDDASLKRARAGVFDVHAVANLPVEWVASCFRLLDDGRYELSDEIRRSVSFAKGDAATDAPPGPCFDLVLARYSLFLYLAPVQAKKALERVRGVLGGTLVCGLSDQLPRDHALDRVPGAPAGVYRSYHGTRPKTARASDGLPATLTELLAAEGDVLRPGPRDASPPRRLVSRASRDILEKTARGEDPFPAERFPRTAAAAIAPARPRTAVGFGSAGPLPASPPRRRPRTARVIRDATPAKRLAPPAPPVEPKRIPPEKAQALVARLTPAPVPRRARPASAPRPVSRASQPPRATEYVPSLPPVEAQKLVERLTRPARREQQPVRKRRRKGGKKVKLRNMLSRMRRCDSKRKKRFRALQEAVFTAERGVESDGDAVGLQKLSLLAAAPRPPPPTRRPPAPPPAQAARPRTADLGYTARCARSRPVRRSAPVAPAAPVVRYRMDTVVGRIEYRPTRPAPQCTDVPSFLRRPAKLLTPA